MTGTVVVDEHWQQVYRHLHAHPELSGVEDATADLVAQELRSLPGWEVTTGVGGTGVVGVLRGAPGPVVWLRADMDALPVQEDTDLEYASTVPGVMHACGHDFHVAALLAVCAELAASDALPGTIVAIFQPAEETGSGATAMLDDGVLEKVPRPWICLGQHVSPLPAGLILTRGGPLMAAADSVRVSLTGEGGHASTPHLAVDSLAMAASLVLRLQALTARQTSLSAAPVLTAAALHAGQRANIIADSAEILLSLRTFTPGSRRDMLEAIDRIVLAEATAAGAQREPVVEVFDSFPLTVNTPGATERVMTELTAGGLTVFPLPKPITGSEDFGLLGAAAGCPSVFWHIGGADPSRFTSEDQELLLTEGSLPSRMPVNHSPRFAPDPRHALPAAVAALVTAARAELEPTDKRPS
ncbi:amidohydrolase [Nocardia sp. NBC_01009]|uniref:amidohydrolase n=1 Tax=Nocardia sp. NBC_01009 TaxID=2975996 RepID=UPI00386AE56B|nr:amidohydrolase [Nocardia sp. NBC_01009]